MQGYIDKSVLVYLDNVLIYCDNVEQHEQHLYQVLSRLHEHKLHVKLNKCDFNKPQFSILVT